MGLWRVLSDLEEDGYRTEWGLFSAEETGAPHQRIRVFILAKLPDTSSEGLQGNKLRGSCDEQVEGLQGSHESASELHQVRDGQLGDSCSDERWDLCGQQSEQGQEAQSRSCNSSKSELAHTASREPRQSQARNGGQDIGGGSEDTRWPARPGEEQYEWEEPRVTEAQSCVGLSANGTAFRVDELRLLGNGVVPDTCELAFKTLIQQL